MFNKYIVREVEPEAADFSLYFDDDGLTSAGGSYFYNLFIVSNDGYGRRSGFNMEEYEKITRQAENIIDGFADVREDGFYSWTYTTFKECMIDNGISYNPRKCHTLKEWALDADAYNTEDIAKFLTITTGKEWSVASARGYCQGDYVEIVYCPEYYESPEEYGEIWLGAAKEFCVIDLDENGEEIDSCYGYIVADCKAWRDEDYKRIVCEWAGIDQNETRLEMIDNYTTYREYSYRIA